MWGFDYSGRFQNISYLENYFKDKIKFPTLGASILFKIPLLSPHVGGIVGQIINRRIKGFDFTLITHWTCMVYCG